MMQPITSRTDWTPALIEQVWREIEIVAKDVLDIDTTVETYPNQFEIVSAENMIDAYASIGMPVCFPHWSFGKEFLQTQKKYQKGRMGLALEMVINTSPCINYLMEDNDMVAQTMVMAHAGVGHNAFFKNNVFFKEWTDATNIVDYMVFAKEYIRMCEERYGELEVEKVLDACHALGPHGIDKYKRKHQPKVSEELRLQKLLQEEEDRRLSQDVILRKTSFRPEEVPDAGEVLDDEENLLYYIMKKSPNLPQWKREIMRICYKMNRYFQPQGATKVSNEGFATFVHYQLMTALEEKGIITPDGFISFIDSHASVVFQPSYKSRYWSGINPYALGFAIYMDIKRICENPTDEDRQWMPHLIGKRWQDAVKEAAYNYRDDGFISQYLSPKVMRDLRLFTVKMTIDEDDNASAIVSDIHDELGYREMRTRLAQAYERINYVPQIIVRGADLAGDRTLHLEYVPYKGRVLNKEDMEDTLQHVDYLWGYAVELDIP